RSRSRRTWWQSAGWRTSTCADSAGNPLVMSHTCTSWTEATPGWAQIAATMSPEGYAPGDIVAAICAQPGVASVHDVHVWLITSGFPALSAHVLVRQPADCHQVRRDLERLLADRFSLDHT